MSQKFERSCLKSEICQFIRNATQRCAFRTLDSAHGVHCDVMSCAHTCDCNEHSCMHSDITSPWNLQIPRNLTHQSQSVEINSCQSGVCGGFIWWRDGSWLNIRNNSTVLIIHRTVLLVLWIIVLCWMTLVYFSADFTYAFIQRGGLRDPVVFEKPDGLGIK